MLGELYVLSRHGSSCASLLPESSWPSSAESAAALRMQLMMLFIKQWLICMAHACCANCCLLLLGCAFNTWLNQKTKGKLKWLNTCTVRDGCSSAVVMYYCITEYLLCCAGSTPSSSTWVLLLDSSPQHWMAACCDTSLPQQHDDTILCLPVYDFSVGSVSAAFAFGACHCLQIAYYVYMNMHKWSLFW